MGGPTASVLFRDAFDSAAEAKCKKQLGLCAATHGDDFEIQGRPFALSFGEDYAGQFSDLVDEGLEKVLGWAPKGAVGLAAMCNDEIDHRLLGMMCLRAARSFDGVVDLGARWSISGQRDAPGPAAIIENPSGLTGKLFV